MPEEKSKIEYLSLKEAGGISGYSSDYLGWLIRRKKLGGVKIGRDLFTTRKALEAYLAAEEFVAVEAAPSLDKAVFFFLPQLKFSPKFWLTIFFTMLSLAVAIYLLYPFSIEQKKSAGDFVDTIILQTEKVYIGQKGGETIQSPQKIEVTTYLTDKSGDVEISIKPSQAPGK